MKIMPDNAARVVRVVRSEHTPWSHLIVAALSPERGDASPLTRVHTYHAVVLCTAGEGVYEAGAAYTVRAGDVYVVPAGTPHALRRVEGLKLWGVGFCPACFAAQGEPALLTLFERVRAGAAAVARVGEERQARLAWLLRTLSEEQEGAAGAGCHAQGETQGTAHGAQHVHGVQHAHSVQLAALSMILVEVARAAPFEATPLVNAPLVAKALALIERRCLEPLSLRDVAAALSRSPSHLTARVREVTGKTVQGWIIAGRMSEARRRLMQTDERVDIIAERVGYGDVTHFIRLFRREQGMTPAAWRRLHQRRV
jgi:AraC family transcriptional regulator, transcriptional activator of pobA